MYVSSSDKSVAELVDLFATQVIHIKNFSSGYYSKPPKISLAHWQKTVEWIFCEEITQNITQRKNDHETVVIRLRFASFNLLNNFNDCTFTKGPAQLITKTILIFKYLKKQLNQCNKQFKGKSRQMDWNFVRKTNCKQEKINILFSVYIDFNLKIYWMEEKWEKNKTGLFQTNEGL